jgi:YVTN family beta-propeller protein
MEFRILGPLEVRDGERTVELGAAKQRALLGVLLLNANELVSTSRLVEELWGERPPATAEKLVQGYVHALRKRLGADVIQTQGPGYKLQVGRNALDLLEFERLIAAAREAPLREAVDLRRRALSLWRGPPLGDVVIDGSARFALARLEEIRLTTQLERIEGELELGHHAGLVAELESLVAQYPYQESAHALLMLALYRSGRQADALATYQTLRRRLDEELGLQPSQELRDLEAAILRQDEALARPPREDAAATTPAAAEAPPEAHAPRRSRALPLAGGVAVLLVGAAIAAAVMRDEPATVAVAPDSVALIDPERNRVVEAVQVGIQPGPIAARDGAVWVANVEDRTLARIEPRTARVVKYVSLPATPTGVAVGADGAVWVAHGRRGQLSRVDPAFARVTATIDVTRTSFGTSTGSVAVGLGAVWAAYGDSTLARIDRTAVRRTGATFAGIGPVGVAVGAASIWVAQGGEPTVERFSPATFEEGPVTSPITVGDRPTGIAYGERAVWTASAGDDAVFRIDPNANSARSIPVGDEPSAVAVGGGAVWVANAGDGTVARIDPVTYEVDTIEIGGAPAGIAVADGRVWVTVREP